MTARFNPADATQARARSDEIRAALVNGAGITAPLVLPYVVKGWLGAGQISVVAGPSNVGKTFFALDIAHHVAAGLDWHGRRVLGGEVVYIAAEGGGPGLAARLQAVQEDLRHRRGLDLESLKLWLLPVAVTLTGERADTDFLCDAIMDTMSRQDGFRPPQDRKPGAAVPAGADMDRGGVRLIVIDTMARVMGDADENDARGIDSLIRNVELIRDRTGAHIMLVHHVGKDASRGLRGHSSLRGAIDTEIIIEREEAAEGGNAAEINGAQVTKQRDGRVGEVFRYRLREMILGLDQDCEPVTSCVCQPIAPAMQEAGAGADPTAPVAEVSFSEVPPLGTVLPCGAGDLILKSASHNAPGYKLYWMDPKGGRYQSGLCGPVTPYVRPPKRRGT